MGERGNQPVVQGVVDGRHLDHLIEVRLIKGQFESMEIGLGDHKGEHRFFHNQIGQHCGLGIEFALGFFRAVFGLGALGFELSLAVTFAAEA